RAFCLSCVIMGFQMAHCSSVRSEGYFFLQRPSWSIFTHSSTEGICANYLIKLYFCQSIFPDSLLDVRQAVQPQALAKLECGAAFARGQRPAAPRHGRSASAHFFASRSLSMCSLNVSNGSATTRN